MKLKHDPWQKQFLQTQGDKIMCTGRQVGKSETCGEDAGSYAVNNSNKNILMIAPTERQAYALFEKTLNWLIENHPKMIMKGKDRPTQTKINLINKTRILCLPVGIAGVGIRGLTVHRLYVDEASRIPEDVWSAVTPMLLTTGGNMIILSTPFGAQGTFYKIWINEGSSYDSFTRFSISSEEVIEKREICDTWTERQRAYALTHLEREKKRMSEREYAQEYLGRFMDDLHRYFSDKIIEECCTLTRPNMIRREFKHFLGVDIARMGEDESTFEIIMKIDKDNFEHVESIITKKTRTTQTEEKIINLHNTYNFKEIDIDAGSGSLGVGVFDHLLDHPKTKSRVVAINNRQRSTDADGKKNIRLMKEDLYDNLLAMMQRRKVKLLNDDEVKESLRSVQYEYVKKENGKTTLRIFGNYTHVVEGLIRAMWAASKNKSLNLWCR